MRGDAGGRPSVRGNRRGPLPALASRLDDAINDALVEEIAGLVTSFCDTTAQEGRAMGSALKAMKRVADSGRLVIDLVA